ncbi:MAG: ATP-binding protein [Micropepsaceae bacterium]
MKLSLPLWLEITVTVLLALAASNLATMLVLRNGMEHQFERLGSEFSIQNQTTIANLVLKAPEDERAMLAARFSTAGLSFTLDQTPSVAVTNRRDRFVEQAISGLLTTKSPSPVRAHIRSPDERPSDSRTLGMFKPNDVMLVSIAADKLHWLNIRSERPVRPPPVFPIAWSAITVIAALVIASLWIASRLTQPLQKLAAASSLLKRGEFSHPVPVQGPAPMREAATAFNAMSDRVMTMLKSQRAMMSAIAHDLRTPIAAMRFRTEFVQDEDIRARLNQNLDEMQGMTDAVLDAVRFEGSAEPSCRTDVAMLVESVCADMEDMGLDVTLETSTPMICICRTPEIKRALRNLIENAVRYGTQARVSIEQTGDSGQIHVDDDGAGIPEEQISRVFEPFVRLEESRNRDTGGYGLGLSIARMITRGHGGDVNLSNRRPHGLRATLSLPLA